MDLFRLIHGNKPESFFFICELIPYTVQFKSKILFILNFRVLVAGAGKSDIII